MRLKHACAVIAASALIITTPAYVGSANANGPASLPSLPAQASDSAKQALAAVQEIFSSRPDTSGMGERRLARADNRADATSALLELRRQLDDLGPADRAKADQYFLRPDSGGDGAFPGYEAGATKAPPLCGPNVCVHRVTNTEDEASAAEAQQTLDIAEHSWKRIVTKGGYRAPRGDGNSANNGGNAKLDIYLANLGKNGLFGYCTSDDPNISSFRFSAYCAVDNDFAEFGGVPLQLRQVTVAHEFFHAVQFAYDGFEDRWFSEGTAAWIEDEIYDNVNDNMIYLTGGFPNPISNPRVPLDAFNPQTYPNYGTWTFWKKLSETYPKKKGGLPVIVRKVWENAANLKPKGASTFALEDVLKKEKTTFAKFYAKYATGNRFPNASYKEGKANGYPTSPLAPKGSAELSKGKRKASKKIKLDHMSSATYRFTPKKLSGKKWRLRLTVNAPDLKTGSAATVVVYKKKGGRNVTRVKLNKKGGGTQRVAFGNGAVKRVEITLSNGSTRFKNCYPSINYSPFTCGGRSKDDGLKFTVKAAVTR